MSAPRRFFAENLNYPQSVEAVLEGEEFAHAKTVLRVQAGDEVILLDNSGKEYCAIVGAVGKTSLTAHITSVSEGGKEPRTEIYLLCGFLKNADRNEFIVQKAVELGAGRIAFFSSEYSSAFMSGNKLERLNRVSREAAKQCLRSRAPEIVCFGSLGEALGSAAAYKNKLFACEFAKGEPQSWAPLSGSVACVVGSEGGFSEREYKEALGMGFKGISLGKRILRAETAATAMCALAAYFSGELG